MKFERTPEDAYMADIFMASFGPGLKNWGAMAR